LGVNSKKRLRAEKGYTLDRTIMRLKKGKTNHAKYREKFAAGVKASKEMVDDSEFPFCVIKASTLTKSLTMLRFRASPDLL